MHEVLASRFALFLLAATFLPVMSNAAGGESIEASIRRAGNAEDDAARLAILETIRKRSDLDATLKADLDKMVAFVRRWQTDESLWRWYCREIRHTTDYDFKLSRRSPLEPLACLYRGRMLVWVTNEYGNIIGYHESRRKFFDKAVEQFKIARAAFPENRVIGMYLGEPIPWPKQYREAAAAPRWARLMRENLDRLTDIVLWWIDNRMRPNGEFGGAWDDDCEMWRHWVPVMIAFEHPEITKAQTDFSRALLSQPYMKDGYTNHVYDVEHTAEPSTDTITPMMHLAPDDPEWRNRATRLAELMRTLWTGRNQRGRLQFKSTYFGARRVDDNPRRACDTPYHAIAVQPALLLWQRTGDKRLGKLFADWMDTWVDAAARSERGKPAGILPAAIHWPDGATAGPGKDWWNPEHHNEPKLYVWPSALGKLTDTLLLTYHMTGDEKYLSPIRSMAAVRLAWLNSPTKQPPAPGSKAWCGSKLRVLAGTLAKYRLLTGSKEFDEILDRDYAALTISESDGDHAALAQSLQHTAEALRVNRPGYTSEVRFTDRVFTFPRLFRSDMMFTRPVPASNKRPNMQLLYLAATGDRGDMRICPLGAVRWLTSPRDIAALVTRSGGNRLTAELFHFGRKPRSMGAELYLLSPGRYTFQLVSADEKTVAAKPVAFSVTGPRTRISFELPAEKLCVLRVLPD